MAHLTRCLALFLFVPLPATGLIFTAGKDKLAKTESDPPPTGELIIPDPIAGMRSPVSEKAPFAIARC